MTSPTKQEPVQYQYCWKCKTLNPEGHYCACVCRKSPPYVRADAYTALQATVAERDARLKAAHASNQDAADLLLAINKHMHARNPGAVTAIDVWRLWRWTRS